MNASQVARFLLQLTLFVASMNLHVVCSTAQNPVGVPTRANHEFRIDTDVYDDETKPPTISTQLFFQEGRAIEWDDDSKRVMIVDDKAGLITVADLKNKQLTKIDMVQLDSIHSSAVAQLNPNQRALAFSNAPPKMNQNAFYWLESKSERYQFKVTKPNLEWTSKAYAKFADWSVKIYAHYPPHRPALLRIQMDEFFIEQGALPTEIRRTNIAMNFPNERVARLQLKESLDGADRATISQIENGLRACKQISPSQFFQ